jgi:hypothetical protein
MRNIIITWSAIILLAGGILGVAAVFSADWPRDCSDVKDCHQQCECNRSHCLDSCGRNDTCANRCNDQARDCHERCH